jgi:hypothetical protein
MSFRAVAAFACLLSATLAAGCTGLSKSENPLSPTVAGPIPGVNIGQPVPLDPKDGRTIEVANQPITLVLANAQTNGVRPLSYTFEVATDTGFASKVFVREGVTPGANGQTSLRLSDSLGTGRTYYWRALALDGANTGPYSGFAHFSIFTPIVIQKPVLLEPVNNVLLDRDVPVFRIANAPRSGPVGPLFYTIEVADSDNFTNRVAIWTIGEQANQTSLTAPSALAPSKQYFWRAHATDGGNSGPLSDTAAFRTPAPPPPTGGGGGFTICTAPIIPNVTDCSGALAKAKADLIAAGVSIAGDCGAFRIVSRAAGMIPGAGYKKKPGGTNCNGYSIKSIMFADGADYEVLSSPGDTNPGNPIANGPEWVFYGYSDRSLYAPAN